MKKFTIIIAISFLPNPKEIKAQAINAKNIVPEESPSSPSVRFTALDAPIITKIAHIGYKYPILILVSPNNEIDVFP